ncbi:hypothetical protein ACJ41O_010232 [Fusarium nematophilum]
MESEQAQPYHPVTFFISVKKGSTPWEQAHTTVTRCHKIIQDHGIHDVEVEMKESDVSRLVSSPAEAPPTAMKLCSGPMPNNIAARSQWSEYQGVSIAAFDNPSREGTKCLYLRRKDTGATMALTCRHVVFKETAVEKVFEHPGNDAARLTIIQPGDETLAEHRALVKSEIGTMAEDIQTIDESGKDYDAKRRQKQPYLDCLVPLEEVERALGNLEDPATRIIGHVIYAPEYSTGKTETGGPRLRDWALIELHQGKHSTPLDELRNRVLVGNAELARKQMMKAKIAEGLDVKVVIPDFFTHTVPLAGTISEAEMKNPREEAKTIDEPAILVAKYGRTTNFTVGLANNVKSLTRKPIGGTTFLSEEWCIIGQRRVNGRRVDFSWDGDSGSCVWDLGGRIGGMLTGGNGDKTNGGFDVSYVTPIEWLLKDIKDKGFDVELA